MKTTVLRFAAGDRALARRFTRFPFDLYRGVPQWVPPIGADERAKLSPRHPFYRHSQAAFFLAEDARGSVRGRLALLDHRLHNAYSREHTAFFCLFECVDDLPTARALFDAGAEWAAARGLDCLFGPKGFTALDGLGLLVRGFEHRPALGQVYNPPYYLDLLAGCGFAPAGREILSGYLPGSVALPDKVEQVAARVQERGWLRVRSFGSRVELRALVRDLPALYNGAMVGTESGTPLTLEEARAMANQLLLFADPRLIKLIYKEDTPVGFLLAYPDVSAAVQRCGGRFFPLGWLYLLLELRRAQWININGAGIIDRYRGLGGTALLFSEMAKSVRLRGTPHAEVVQIGAENERMLNELRGLGVDFYKAHQMYRRAL